MHIDPRRQSTKRESWLRDTLTRQLRMLTGREEIRVRVRPREWNQSVHWKSLQYGSGDMIMEKDEPCTASAKLYVVVSQHDLRRPNVDIHLIQYHYSLMDFLR